MKTVLNRAQKLILLTLMTVSPFLGSQAHGETGKSDGGGGSIEELRAAGALSENQIVDLLKENGRRIKSDILVPMFESFSLSFVKDNEIAEKTAATIGENKSEFLDSMSWMDMRITDCECPATQSACRKTNEYNNNYTCYHPDRLVKQSTDLSDLVGLAVHEISRIRINPDSSLQDTNHRLAYFFKDYFSKLDLETLSSGGAPNEFGAECAQRRGTSFERINACVQHIKNIFAMRCALSRGISIKRIIACGGIKSEAAAECAVQRGTSDLRILACARL